jgi:2-amino-4-hydroxy-6-hydroxymethyldihydropteridine diphosphokinase
MPLVRAYIALGSNLGDRIGQMQSALKALAADDQLKLIQISPVYENRALGMGEADDFLNAIAGVETSMAPLALLDCCLEVESQLGRVRTGEWAPRTIDLDIIAYGNEVIEHERLQVPHPRIAERDFVVHPLSAIAPNLEIRGQRVAYLAAALPMDSLTLCELKLELV